MPEADARAHSPRHPQHSGSSSSSSSSSAERAVAAPEQVPGVGQGLSEREQQLLVFERAWFAHAGAKEQAIREQFGISSARYHQLLGALLERPAALVFDPMLVNRLHRLRDARLARRSARLLKRTD